MSFNKNPSSKFVLVGLLPVLKAVVAAETKFRSGNMCTILQTNY